MTLQQDDALNRHECMPQLISLIDYMTANGVYKVPKEGEAAEELPGWMEALRAKLSMNSTHRNVRLFILKLISNCSQVMSIFKSKIFNI